MISNAELRDMARRVFDRFSMVDAKFEPHADLKITWCRTAEWVKFGVSDYLREMPTELMLSLLKTLNQKMQSIAVPYPYDVSQWLQSEEFRDINLPIRIERMKARYPDIDYDVESEINERVYDMLFDMEDEGIEVAPVSFATVDAVSTDAISSGGPWSCSLLFKEIIMERSFINKLSDAQLKAVLRALLNQIHTPFEGIAGPAIRNENIIEDAVNFIDGDEAKAELKKLLKTYLKEDEDDESW